MADEHLIIGWLNRARRRHWLRRAIGPLTAGTLLAALSLLLPPLLGLDLRPVGVPIALICLAAGLVVGSRRRPSLLATARLVDTDLGLRERVTTALDTLGRPRSGDLATRQLEQTAALLARVRPAAALPLGPAARPALLGLAGAVALVGGVLLAGAVFPTGGATTARTGLPDPGDAAQPPAAGGPPAPLQSASASGPAMAGSQVDESRRQQAALDRLADALGDTAAARDAAEALRGGDAQGAADRLADLARENDQLSPQAREQLAQALRSAAADPSSAPLAQAERSAADALAGQNYRQREQSLTDLADAVRRGGQQVAPYEDLARAGRENGGLPPSSAEPAAGRNGAGDRPLDGAPGAPAAAGVAGRGSGGRLPGEAGSGPGGNQPPAANARLGVDGVPVELDPAGQEGPGRTADPNAPPPIRTRLGPGAATSSGSASPSDIPVSVTEASRGVTVDARGAVRDYLIPPGQPEERNP